MKLTDIHSIFIIDLCMQHFKSYDFTVEVPYQFTVRHIIYLMLRLFIYLFFWCETVCLLYGFYLCLYCIYMFALFYIEFHLFWPYTLKFHWKIIPECYYGMGGFMWLLSGFYEFVRIGFEEGRTCQIIIQCGLWGIFTIWLTACMHTSGIIKLL